MFTTHPQEDFLLTAALRQGVLRPSNIPTLDEYADGDIFVWMDETGPRRVVRAQSWESAWETVVDDLPTVDTDEASEAYDERDGLAEGYEHQANASGSGVVFVGYYARMSTLDDYNAIAPEYWGKIVPVFTPW